MRVKQNFWFMIVLIAVMAVQSPLSAQRTGRVTGGVVEKESQTGLIGANVMLVGTKLGAVTDNQGLFLIGNVPPGTYQILVRYIGYAQLQKSVEVTSDGVATVNFEMQSSAVQMDEVSVTTDRILQSQSAALNAQYNASNIRNVVSSDLMGSFPDEEAVEAISRIPGVVVDGEEAIMRGMPAEWSLVTVNGEKIPSVNAAVDRSSSLNTFPIDLIQAIEVSKGQTADMDADAIAGNVNFILKDAPGKRLFTGKLYGGINPDMTKDFPIKQIDTFGQLKTSLTIGDVFMNGKLGYSITGTYLKETSSDDKLRTSYDFSDTYWKRYQNSKDELGNPTPPGLRYTRKAPTQTQEVRGGFNTAILWRPSLGNKLMFKTYFSAYNLKDNDLELTNRYTYFNKKAYDGYKTKLMDVKTEGTWTMNAALGGEHLIANKLNLDWALHYTAGKGGEAHDSQSEFRAEYAALKAGDKTYHFTTNNFENETFLENDLITAVNLRIPFTISKSTYGYGKTGFKYHSKDRYQQKLDSSIDMMDAEDLADPTSWKDFTTMENDPFIKEWDPAAGLFLETDSGSDIWENYLANETVVSAYAMTEMWFGDHVMFLPGLRVEKTTTESEPRTIETYLRNNPEEVGVKNSAKASGSYTDLFPSLNVRLKLPMDFDLRLSGSRGISRPSFRLMIGYNDYDAINLTLNAGNPDLRATRSTNMDVILERYSKDMASQMSVGFFRKNITDVMQSVFRTWPEDANHMHNGYHVTELEITENVGTGIANGIELSIQRQLDFLRLPQVGILANWTHQMDSYLKTEAGEKMALPRQAKDVYNIAVSLELAKLGFSGRVSYQHKSEVFREMVAFGERWTKPIQSLDLNLRQNIVKGVKLVLNARNLLAEDNVDRLLNLRPDAPEAWVPYNVTRRGREYYGGFDFSF